MIKEIRERFWDKKQRLQNELEDSEAEAERALKASNIIDNPRNLLKYLKNACPDTLPSHEVSSWELGVLKGQKDVVSMLEHLIETASK